MTQRLPTPGSDDGTWGDVLNGFLEVEHNADGTLKIRTDGSVAPLASGKVPTANLGSGTASGSNYLRGDGTWAVPSGTAASNATTSTPGLIQLSGDLGGTNTSATAPTLAATSNVTSIINTAVNANITVAGAAQKSNNLSDLASVTTAKTNLGLSPVATSGSYTDLTSKPTIPAAQVNSDWSASTGVSQILNKPTIPTSGTTSSTYAVGNDSRITGALQSTNNLSDLVSPSTARTNLGLGTAATISATAGGDLTGTLPAPTVSKINGVTLPSTAPSAGNVLTAASPTTTSWTTPAAGVTLDATSADIQPLGTQTAGSVGKAADAGHVHAMPTLNQVSAPTTSVALNAQKITGLANGTASTDAAAFGQIPVAGTTSSTYTVGNDVRVTGAIQSSTATTKGDILAASATSTITRVGVGTNNQVLTADSTQTAGIKWATPTTTDVTKLAIANNLSDLASVSTARTNLGVDASGTQRPSLTIAGWAANTSYVAGQFVLSPSGQYTTGVTSLIQANSSFTSSSSFSTSNWTQISDIDQPIGTTAGTVAAGNDSRIVGALQSGATAGGDLTGTYPSPTLTGTSNVQTVVQATQRISQVTVYPTAGSYSYTIPSWAVSLSVLVIGGGGGGGSGSRKASGTASAGGGGGGGGGRAYAVIQASLLTSPVSVSVGAGGTGGTATTSDNSTGNSGSSGSISTFGSYLRCAGGTLGSGSGGNGGAGTPGNGAGGAGTAGIAGASAGTASIHSPTGGGGGGGITTTPSFTAGGAGGVTATISNVGANGGTTDGAAGTSGTASTINDVGAGGGGGASSITTVGGAGASGGSFGAGGGGGGASLNTLASGAGGSGAAGIVIIVAHP